LNQRHPDDVSPWLKGLKVVFYSMRGLAVLGRAHPVPQCGNRKAK